MIDQFYRVSMQQRYFSLCLKQIAEYEAIKKQIECLEREPVTEDEAHIVEMNIYAKSEELEQAVVAPIVSAAMALEAFSYDYAATRLGDSFTKNHLDKLEIPSRIVIASKLITGKEFPVDGQAYEGIKALVKTRNKIVHFKSKQFPLSQISEAAEFVKSFNEELEVSMYQGRDALRELMKEIDRLHGKGVIYEYSLEPIQCHA